MMKEAKPSAKVKQNGYPIVNKTLEIKNSPINLLCIILARLLYGNLWKIEIYMCMSVWMYFYV